MPNYDGSFTRLGATEINVGNIALRAVDDTAVVPTLRLAGTTVTATGTDLNLLDQTNNATLIGAVTTPTGTLTCSITRVGSYFKLVFTLTAVRITVTDADASGSYGATKLFDFVAGRVVFLASYQDYTAYAEGAALTGAAGDAAFEIGIGTDPISEAADGELDGGTQENVGVAVAQTLSEGTTTGTGFVGTPFGVDGTDTPTDLYLNLSGSAATIDASSTIDVTGTITVVGMIF